jgi:chromosome segregation ATPase
MLIAMLVTTPLCYAQSSEEKTSIEEVKQETQDLIQALEAYTADQRDEAVQRASTALNNLDERIDALEKRIDDNWDQMNKAAREKARANLKALRKKRNEVAEWYGSLKTSSTDTWEHMKKGFSDAYKALGDAWEKSEKEFGANN